MRKRIGDILSYSKIGLKKISNSIKYSPFEKFIHNDFGNKQKLIEYNKSRTTGPEPCVCHAPLRSLYFDIYGNATACCFNRAHILGKYPQQSISQIIHGEKRSFLQKELCRQNFMYGCQHCHKLIEAGNFEGTEAHLYDNLKDQGIIPSEIVFELDNTCNLACRMCHEGFSSTIAREKGVAKIIPPYDDEFLNQLREYIPTLKVAKFLGGEPFLINIYYKIWDLILELNPKCKIHLQTNGTVFNDMVKSYLERGNFYIGVSVDSLQKEVFESIRCNADFEKVMQNIDQFAAIAKRKHNYVNISVCPMIQNCSELPAIVDFCNKKGLFVYFNTVYTEGFALSSANEDKLLELLNYYRNYKFTSKGIISNRNIKFFQNLCSNLESWYKIKEQASRYTNRKHEWTGLMLKDLILSKSENNEIVKEKIEQVFYNFNQHFLLSDQDVDNLNNIKPEDIAFIIINESVEQIHERIVRFVEKGEFGE